MTPLERDVFKLSHYPMLTRVCYLLCAVKCGIVSTFLIVVVLSGSRRASPALVRGFEQWLPTIPQRVERAEQQIAVRLYENQLAMLDRYGRSSYPGTQPASLIAPQQI